MKIQTKLIASTLPILLVVFFALGYWSFRTTRDIMRTNSYKHINAVLEARLSHTFQHRSDLLLATKMDKVASFVMLYQQEAFEDLMTGADSSIGCFYVFDRKAELLFASGNCSEQTVLAQYRNIALRTAADPAQEFMDIIKTDGMQYILGAKYFKPWEWVLIYSIDNAESEKGISNIFAATIGLTGLCVLICAIVMIIVSRKIIGAPILKLKTAAARIANRETGVVVEVQTKDEFRDLAVDINKMSASISNYINKLKQITEDLAQSNDSLRESEKALHQTVSAGNVGLWDWDLNTGKIYFSPQWKKQIGYEEHELEGRYEEWENRIHPDDLAKTLSALKASQASPWPPFKVEFRLRHKDGSYRWILAEGALERDEQTKPVRMKGSHVDITDRKQAEEAIIVANKEWQQTFDSVPDLLFLMGRDHRILRANKAMLERFGLTPDDMTGRYCHEIVHDTSAPPGYCPCERLLNSGKEEQSEFKDEQIGGQFEVRTSPVHDKTGQLIGCVHILRDITEQRKLEEKLRQAQKMEAIGTLAGGIAHDFNNILTPILGYTDMVLNCTDPDSPMRAELQQVFIAATRAKDLVKQILTFSRKSKGEIYPLKIQLVVKEALKLLRSSIPTNIEIKVKIDQQCPSIMADPTHIHQILMNLCTNAYHSMIETGGMLQVSLSSLEIRQHDLIDESEFIPGTYVLLEVSDSGPGIRKEIIDKIFEPYFTTKLKGEGTGLGLALVHGIVQSYKGAIKVYSESGKGTVFRVYFPAIVAESIPKQINQKIIPLPSGRERVILVDDEEIVTSILEKMLSSLGYKVSVFTCSEDALADFKTQPDNYDLIITDMTMPKITGDKLAEEILSIRPNMPIILCTGYSDLISKEKIQKAGFCGYLTKPILINDLAIAVRNALDRK